MRQLFGTEGEGAIPNDSQKAAREALARINETKELPEGLTQEDLDYYKQVMEKAAKSPNNPNETVQKIREEIVKAAEGILREQ